MAVRSSYRQALAPALRRVQGVRITVGAEHPRAEAYGIGSHHPAVLPVPLGLAARLVREGAPLTLHAEPTSVEPHEEPAQR